jgi:hypothetical protein
MPTLRGTPHLLREMRLQVLRIHQVLQEYLRFGRMPKSERAVLR